MRFSLSSSSGSSYLLLAPKPIFSPLNCSFHQRRYPINVSLSRKQELKKRLLNKVLLERHSQVKVLQKVFAHRMKFKLLMGPEKLPVSLPLLIRASLALATHLPAANATGPAGQVAPDKGKTQSIILEEKSLFSNWLV